MVRTNTESQVAADCEDARQMGILAHGCDGPPSEPSGGTFDVVGLRPNALYLSRYLPYGGHCFTTNDRVAPHAAALETAGLRE